MRRLLAGLPLLAGCLVIADPEPYLGMPGPGDSGGPCDESSDCLDPQRCRHGVCVPRCVDEDCPGGFACDEYLYRCADLCLDETDCQEGWFCCDGSKCDWDDWGECLPDP